jgi:endoglucanase
MIRQALVESLDRLSHAGLRLRRWVVRRETFSPLDPFDQVARMGRGVNILGYDPLWIRFRRTRFQRRHFRLIHEGGFQTVRVNLRAFRHMNRDHQLSAKWFRRVDWIVENALANHLQVILDEHDFDACGKDLYGCRTRLRAFWKEVAERYKDAPNSVMFELLNEPNTQLMPDVWNVLLNDILSVVRETNSRRNVVIGPAGSNSIDYLDQLKLPPADRNIIVTVHYYLPVEFTHQGAHWYPPTAGLSGVKWGSAQQKRRIAEDFDRVQQWSKKENRPVLLGEFGAYDTGDMDSRVSYTSHAARTAERLGWAWTYWQFDSDFVVWDMERDAWVQPIWKALVP